ncbi:monothiol glutaredoxin-S1-like [Cornus florida]|uniref:monothiol glutaredoxin-S1-like n=1 Tax=Cornus florida TaxID=4283 RepID=UPI00289E2634|nr:monothiol glutaredoxin-S1-like [Cornus florida]
MATLESLVGQNPVVIFSKSSCCICHSIKQLICSFGANPIIYKLNEHPDGQQIERELGRRSSLPAVFIGQELVGSAREVTSLHVRGQLAQKLIDAGAIWEDISSISVPNVGPDSFCKLSGLSANTAKSQLVVPHLMDFLQLGDFSLFSF